MPHAIRETVGKQLSEIYRPSSPLKFKPCDSRVNPKSQAPNSKEIPNDEYPKRFEQVSVLGFENWVLGFIWHLGFGSWDFFPMIRVVLPHHLRTLARVTDEVQLELNSSATVRSILDALEAKFPMLQGTIRDHGTLKRRPMVRFFVCGEDVSLDPADTVLPEAIVNGMEPFIIMGAIAGG